MPSTSSGSAPSSRVYHSAPRLRQKYFPPRDRVVKGSTRTPATLPRIRKQRQSTLTQLDFATSFSRDYGTDEDVDEEDDKSKEADWEAPVANKRRKVARTMSPDERQKTLTQMQWVCPDSDDDEAETLLRDDDDMAAALTGEEVDDATPTEQRTQSLPQEPAVKEEPESPQLASPSQRGAEIPIYEDPSSPTVERLRQSILDTPQQTIKHEVPSSQSPTASVITRSATASVSPHKQRQRLHLEEMTINELTRRDTQLQNTPSKRQKYTEPVQDSNAGDDTLDDDDELFHDEAENQEPEFSIEHFKSTPGKGSIGADPSRTPSSTQSMFEPSQVTGSRARYNMSPSPTPRRLSSQRLAQTPSTRNPSAVLGLDHLSPSSFARPGRIVSSPAGLLQEMSEEQRGTRSGDHSHSPRRTLFGRSSQASTVDITQPSPRDRLLQSSPFISASIAPPRGVSQFPESGHSLDAADNWSRMSNMSAFNSSAPLRTVSQLLGSSPGGNAECRDETE